MEADPLADGGRHIVVGDAEERAHLVAPNVHQGQLATCMVGGIKTRESRTKVM